MHPLNSLTAVLLSAALTLLAACTPDDTATPPASVLIQNVHAGKRVFDNGSATGERPGTVIRRTAI